MSKQRYQRKTHHQHILDIPDTYIGSTETQTKECWIINENEEIVWKKVDINAGFMRIYEEIILNAFDHSVRNDNVKQIRIDVDQKKGRVLITNDGPGIPIEYHETEKRKDGSPMYIPELIFGELLTSSHYDKNQKRIEGGRNGYGGKVCNIFSRKFIVETVCNYKKYKQVFENNMMKKREPKIEECKSTDFTRIAYYPDFPRFKLSGIDDTHLMMMKKRAYDISACSRKNVSVYFNKKLIKCKTFDKYIHFYPFENDNMIYDNVNEHWEIACTITEQPFQVSFVNGIETLEGGTHVDYVRNQIVKKLKEELDKKYKKMNFKTSYIKHKLGVFIKSFIENPVFNSQTKEKLTSQSKTFGSECEVSDKFIKKLIKTPQIQEIISYAKFQENKQLKKSDGKKVKRLTTIDKLDDANKAGTKDSSKCTLILTEGDSAKAFAVSGLSILGRDYYGVYPLKGKLLNVRNASQKQVSGNKEIEELKKIIGLQQGKVYEHTNELRYGKILILTDADIDGSHIKGLVINMIETYWPSLLELDNFITSMKTPIIKATYKKNVKQFYTQQEYEQWKLNNDTKKWTIKYYKGLGTSTSKEAKEYFKDFDKYKIYYDYNEELSSEALRLAFFKGIDKIWSNKRKDWLEKYNRNDILDNNKKITIHDFINKDLIHFSYSDNQRSIPNLCDGLKPSQRKVIYSVLKRNLTKEIKVSQLSGYVSEATAYHHGEMSLQNSIINLAQNFPGSNNLSLLEPNGMFGTRLCGGSDHASPRYIFTCMSPHLSKLFDKRDNALLTYVDDDGILVEPEYYVSTLPIILINGSEGIGTGYSTYISPHNIEDIKNNLKRKLKGLSMVEMIPYFNGFQGTIEKIKKNEYKVYGTYQWKNKKLIINELPIVGNYRWIEKYKVYLNKLLDNKKIKDYENHSTENKVQFHITFDPKTFKEYKENVNKLIKDFKLEASFKTNNMYLFDSQHKLRKFDTTLDILEEFYKVRIEYYQKRKDYLLKLIEKELDTLYEKIKFIEYVMNDKIIVFKQKKLDIVNKLKEFEFKMIDNSYDHLLKIPLYQFTYEKLEELNNNKTNKEKEYNHLLNSTKEELWERDLDMF